MIMQKEFDKDFEIKLKLILVLEKYNIGRDVLSRYNEPHRFYHNIDHIIFMTKKAIEWGIDSDELLLAIIFHDIIYNPKLNNNELLSASIAYNLTRNETIKNAILDTKTHDHYSSQLSEYLCKLDTYNLYGDFQPFIENTYNIFKEYQFVDYTEYQKGRIEFLKKYGVSEMFIDAVKSFRPNIGLYAGSFQPFHKGHYNILEKAEKIFDKVIIARGVNPDKPKYFYTLPKKLEFRQIINYDGLLSDLIDSLDYDVTLIRGLRNSTDLQYEMTQYQYLKDLLPNIKVVSIFCDKEYEHISSSSIRLLEKYEKDDNYLI
jgi:pantetheine-phosphate adenylyltransferase